MSINVLSFKTRKKLTNEERIEAWLEENKILIERWKNLLADIKSSANVGFVTFSVVLRELFDFAQAG
jgi:glutamate dehydrogenase